MIIARLTPIAFAFAALLAVSGCASTSAGTGQDAAAAADVPAGVEDGAATE